MPNVTDIEIYIRGRKDHHKTMSFEDEYLAMLRRTGWDGDPEDAFR